MNMAKGLRLGTALAALLVTSGTGMAAQTSHCAGIAAISAKLGVCADAPNGVVLAATAERAAVLVAIAAAGEARFARHFDRAPPRYAIVDGEGSIDPATGKALEAAGFVSSLPWLSPEATVAALTASIRRGVEQRASAMGASAEATEQMVAAALAQQAERRTPELAAARERGVVPHELGHGWFIRSWWPTRAAGPVSHYGGPAPDWMDEVAAVLMEDDGLAEQRRAGFAARMKESGEARDRLLDLKRFLTMEHPGAGRKLAPPPPGAAPAAGTQVRVLTGEEARQFAADGLEFYLQSRSFADYLIERAGPSRAFVSAAESFAGGATTADWLARHGAALGIATDLDALAADWRRWAEARHAAAAR